jgi:phosphate transport system permease protein
MLVGVMDKAPALPVDGVFPFVHPQRSFMHLAYQIYTVGFRSADAEAAKPMVFTATLLLIAIVAFLNIAAVYLRSRLRRKFVLTQF